MWIKLRTDMFDNEKIRLIESMPEADTIIVIWIKLLAQAGKCNASGCIMLSEDVPMTEEEMATIFNRPLNTVRLALVTLRKFKMIDIKSGDTVHIKNWNIYQNIDGIERIRKQTAARVRKYRKKKRLIESTNEKGNVTSRNSNGTDIDIDIDNKRRALHAGRRIKFADVHMNLAKLFLNEILKNNPNFKKPNLENWANDIRIMMEQDKRTKEQVSYLIRWSQHNAFWQANCLSPRNLRKHFDQMVAQVKREKQGNPQTSNRPPDSESVPSHEETMKRIYGENWQEERKKIVGADGNK